jgi:mutator protein MutT
LIVGALSPFNGLTTRALLQWWQQHGRRAPDLKPWMVTPEGRWPLPEQAIDPYGVLVAEVMLQQTQLQVVLPYWRRWMAAFPSLEALAAAEEQAVLLQWSEALVAAAPGRGRDCNQALMDLGATLCTPRQPSCGLCPWRSSCAAYAAGTPDHYPVKDAPRSVPFQVIGVGVVLNAAGEVLIDQRLNEGLLGGLWEFPGGKQEPGEAIAYTIQRELQEELAIEVEVGEELISLEHAYSHKKLRFVVHLCRWSSGEPQPLASQQVRWVAPAQLGEFPFPAANARIIAALRQHLGIAAGDLPQAG